MTTMDAWYFLPETVAFLRELLENNDKEWFTANRDRYEALMKQPGEVFASLVGDALAGVIDQPVKSKVFRVHRDVRFSKDKTPYKPHIHILFAPSGVEGGPKWFFGLEPDRVAVGTGQFAFEKEALIRYRDRVAGEDGEALQAALDRLLNENTYMYDPALKRVPSGYPSDHPRAELLRRKGIAIWSRLEGPDVVTSGDAVATVVAAQARLKPVFDWLMQDAEG